MKLKRLQLQGYKTFASKTDFDFNAGITAIVGPNGSGKSNIADAIRWVLGEQSYSTLRGKRTADMIFAGSQSRSRAGMAQAIITLDNSDEWLPIDYSEVEIGRRAFRSGENEYLLNGQQVRLRDVQELLATSGLAERTYTIIGQGLVDQALSLRADERRELFEEAAGVSHYKTRRAQTLRQLQETQRNLERVHDILSEIRPRLGALKRQANRARTYEQVEADLRNLLRVWYGYQWKQKKQIVQEQRRAADEAESAWKRSRKRLAEQQADSAGLRRQINNLQDEIAMQRAQREELREKREAARREVAVLSERRTLLQQQLGDLESEIPRLEEQQAEAQSALQEAVGDLQAAQQQLEEREAELEQFNQRFQAQQEEIDTWQRKAERLESELHERQKQLAQAEGQMSQLRERLEERNEGTVSQEKVEEADAKVGELESTVADARERVEELAERRARLQTEQKAARQALEKAQEACRPLEADLNERKEELARLETRCDLLEQLQQIETTVTQEVTLVGRLAGLVEIPSEHRVALDAALGARLDTLILPDEDNLWRLLDSNGKGQSTVAVAKPSIRPPAPVDSPEHEDVIGWASDLVQATDGAEPVMQLLLRTVLLVRTRTAAFELGRQLPAGALAAAPDGFVVHAGGLVELHSRDSQNHVLAREEARRAAQESLEKQRAAVAGAQSDLKAKEREVEERRRSLDALREEEQRLVQQVQEAEGHLAQEQRKLDQARQQKAFLQQQQVGNAQETERLQKRISRLQDAIEEHETEVVRLESAAGDARVQLESLPVAEAKQQRQNRRQEIETARTIVAGRRAVVESRRATLQQVESQLRRQQERRERLQREKRRLDLKSARQTLENVEQEIREIERRLSPLAEKLSDLQASLTEAEDGVRERQKKVHELETHYTQNKVTLSQYENELEGLSERIRADLGLVALEIDAQRAEQRPLPMDEIVERLPDVDELPDDVESSIQEYRTQLQRIGSVNPEAPKEFEETQERYEFLSQQVEDLKKTEQRLRNVIAELDELTSRAFATTVEKVDGIFGKMFERLFGGGAANLVLTEPDDLAMSGVDIACRLPSRRPQRLGLLSGGERSLTAAALIFALLKVAPPPFCVLDEVDAMLDEANVSRFRDVLRELSQDSQFIVITHNRGTVQAAQTVYGVSMGADSTSQVISIRPEEYVNGGEPQR